MATRLRHLAASLIVLFQFQSAACLPQDPHGVRQVVVAAPSPWVTVDPSGAAHTITPIVTTTNGATSTISPPPDALLTTGTYTMSPGGKASTSVGLAPVATATSTANPAGAFLACTMYQGLDEPFCSPKRGSLLYPGYTYYSKPATWSGVFNGVLITCACCSNLVPLLLRLPQHDSPMAVQLFGRGGRRL
jgi:hypothetical protein